jgi:hypothetical protein
VRASAFREKREPAWRMRWPTTTCRPAELIEEIMNIVVLVKQVPDTYSDRTLRESDDAVDRDGVDGGR